MVPGNHHLAGSESIDLEEVKNEAFISSNSGLGVRNITDYYCREAGFVPLIPFRKMKRW
ncbi:hypothetical protein [Bacillus sp. MUM 13]|uniref:hypothetical protein n=1 Tax=Bacillus sp. MUM 13 TaxID=1678001 RepID=UPI00147F0469|nr:hypothetical protein [Bacillus sp. MUM 13]